jgi:hypothetical protein
MGARSCEERWWGGGGFDGEDAGGIQGGIGIKSGDDATRVSKSQQPSDRMNRLIEILGPRCEMCTISCSKSFETFLGFLWVQTMMWCEVL